MPSEEVKSIARWIRRGGIERSAVRIMLVNISWVQWNRAKDLYREQIPEEDRTREQGARIVDMEQRLTAAEVRRNCARYRAANLKRSD